MYISVQKGNLWSRSSRNSFPGDVSAPRCSKSQQGCIWGEKCFMSNEYRLILEFFLLLNSIVACLWYKNMNFFVMSVLTDFLFSLPTIQCLHDHIFCTFTPTSDLHVVHSVNESKFLKYQNFMNQIILLWNFGEVSNI